MSIFRINGWKDAFLHVFAMVGLSAIMVFVFFFIYLPFSTNHGESVTVPDVKGIVLEDLDDFLNSRSLRFEVTLDSGYNVGLPPFAVLKQVPLPKQQGKGKQKNICYAKFPDPPPYQKCPS